MKISFSKTILSVTAIGACFFMSPIVNTPVAYAQSDAAAAAAAEIRFQQLEREIRRLTGQIEEQNYEIRRLKDELAKVAGDLSVRVSDLEGGAGGAPVSISSPSQNSVRNNIPPAQENGNFTYQPPTQQPTAAQTLGSYAQSPVTGELAPSSPKDASASYDFAYSFIKARDFDRAEKEFARFMLNFPTNPLVSNAKYWYGETFYVRGQHEKAARIFAEGYQQFPKASKAASNLLKLGMSLSGMGKNDDACIAYKQLKKEYADSSVPVLKRADTEMKKINCR